MIAGPQSGTQVPGRAGWISDPPGPVLGRWLCWQVALTAVFAPLAARRYRRLGSCFGQAAIEVRQLRAESSRACRIEVASCVGRKLRKAHELDTGVSFAKPEPRGSRWVGYRRTHQAFSLHGNLPTLRNSLVAGRYSAVAGCPPFLAVTSSSLSSVYRLPASVRSRDERGIARLTGRPEAPVVRSEATPSLSR